MIPPVNKNQYHFLKLPYIDSRACMRYTGSKNICCGVT